MKNVKDIKDVQIALNELFDFMSSMKSRNIDMSKRRVINAGPSVALFDYVTQGEVLDKVEKLTVAIEDLRKSLTTKIDLLDKRVWKLENP